LRGWGLLAFKSLFMFSSRLVIPSEQSTLSLRLGLLGYLWFVGFGPPLRNGNLRFLIPRPDIFLLALELPDAVLEHGILMPQIGVDGLACC
jgi:hypothetical protein